ncbi:MAG: hypothetical protein ACYC4R_11020 [Anaerolineae bacterium]
MFAHHPVRNDPAPHPRPWLAAGTHALPVTLIVLGLFVYWFGLADRYAVFLYGHLDATPFDAVTSSRYWMAGLVAGGIVLVLYTLTNLLAGAIARLAHRTYAPPTAWRVWRCCAPAVAIGVTAITMSMNAPTLPLGLALACATSTLAGLILGLLPGAWAATRPRALLGLVPVLALTRALELPAQGILDPGIAAGIVAGCLLGGAVWLAIMGWIRARLRASVPASLAVFVAGLALAYPLAALLHHVFFTPADYRYITTARNLSPESPLLLAASWAAAGLLAWAAAGLLAWGATSLRHRAAERSRPQGKEARAAR